MQGIRSKERRLGPEQTLSKVDGWSLSIGSEGGIYSGKPGLEWGCIADDLTYWIG